MFRRILVPVDGSAPSLLGLDHAIALAKQQRASLRVLNVIDDLVLAPIMMEPSAAGYMADAVDAMREEGSKVLKQAAARAQRGGVKAQTVLLESHGGPVSDAILADARRARADVIVMGTHGRRGLRRLILGSDAERVVREARVPVLLTRKNGTKRRTARKVMSHAGLRLSTPVGEPAAAGSGQ